MSDPGERLTDRYKYQRIRLGLGFIAELSVDMIDREFLRTDFDCTSFR
jgi:hypothetical protein